MGRRHRTKRLVSRSLRRGAALPQADVTGSIGVIIGNGRDLLNAGQTSFSIGAIEVGTFTVNGQPAGFYIGAGPGTAPLNLSVQLASDTVFHPWTAPATTPSIGFTGSF